MAVLPRQRLARIGPGGQRGGRRSSQALSLVELLVGVVLSAVIIGVAVRILVSLIQVDTLQQQELNRKGTVDRVLSLIQEEIRGSRRIQTSGLNSNSTPNCGTGLTPSLILRGSSSATDVAYMLAAVSAGGTYSSSGWIGPTVLVRCGPPYAADGSLNGAQTASPQVILDSLASASGLTITPTSTTSGDLNRTLELTLNSSAKGFNNSTSTVANTVQVPISSNQAYGLLAADGSCNNNIQGCSDPSDSTENTIFFTPNETSSSSITGKIGAENTIYFNANLNNSDGTMAYTIGGTGGRCTIANCTVTRNSITTTITNGSVLIFPDTQIRIPES